MEIFGLSCVKPSHAAKMILYLNLFSSDDADKIEITYDRINKEYGIYLYKDDKEYPIYKKEVRFL